MNNERQYVTNFGQSAPVATMNGRRSGMAHGYTTHAGTTIGNALYPAALGRPMPQESSPSGMRSSGTLPRPAWGGGTTTLADWNALSDGVQQARIDAGEPTLSVPPQLAGIYSAADWARLGAPGRQAAMDGLRPSTAQNIFASVMDAAGLTIRTVLDVNRMENAAEHQAVVDALAAEQQRFEQRLRSDALAGRPADPATAALLAQVQGLLTQTRQQPLVAQPEATKGLSTGAIVGIVAGGVVVLGGLVFVLTMRPRRNPSHKRTRRSHRGY